jgi:hypothetical protein
MTLGLCYKLYYGRDEQYAVESYRPITSTREVLQKGKAQYS